MSTDTRIYRGLGEAEYNELPGARKTALWALHKQSPAHCRVSYTPTEAQKIGAALHSFVLDDAEHFARKYFVRPDERIDRRTKLGKERYAELEQESEGRVILDPSDMSQLESMSAALNANPMAAAMLQGDIEQHELTLTWRHSLLLTPCKARLDGVSGEYAFDIKTAQSAAPDDFSRACAKFGYHLQAAMYLDGAQMCGLPVRHFAFVVVEKTPPFGCAVYVLDDEAMNAGDAIYTSSLQRWSDCVERDRWPGYQQTSHEDMVLALPKYALWEAME